MSDQQEQLGIFDNQGEQGEPAAKERPLAGFPENMVLIDCETTGGKATYHRVIEIGLIVVEKGEIVDTWESFIQPDQNVPEMITRITGISSNMLTHAPRFEDISDLLLEKLKGKIFVAHNARFDYGFIKNEFSRLGIPFKADTLCSVKFSRMLYPQFKRHGLDAIIKRFNFSITNRHRAFDDAEMIYQFFRESSKLFDAEDIAAICSEINKRPALPSKLDSKVIKGLPKAPGVYYFYDDKGALLYVGKSVNIRNRVLNHFSQDHKNPKDLRMSSRIANVTFETTTSDFSAQLLESEQIKALYPAYNRRLRKARNVFAIHIEFDANGYAVPVIREQRMQAGAEESFGLFRTRYQVTKKLEQLADEHELCYKLLGLEKSVTQGRKACFRHQLKKCRGACTGAETPEIYNERLFEALAQYQRKLWPWNSAILLEEQGEEGSSGKHRFHLINNWVYLGNLSLPEDVYDYGYMPAPFKTALPTTGALMTEHLRAVKDDAGIKHEHNAGGALINHENSEHERFDLDTYFILVRFLLNTELMKLNGLRLQVLQASE